MTERRREFNIEPAFVPPVWEETVAACLAKDPAQRPQSAGEVAQRLQLEYAPPAAIPARAPKRPYWIAAGIAALLFAVAGVWYFSARAPSPTKTEEAAPVAQKSVAVLPFENQSADKEDAVFAAGVQREVLASLAKIADLKVISRTSVLSYKSGAPRNLKEIGRELGVNYVVEGGVQREGARVRVTSELVDARSDTVLWAQTFDRELSDIFAIQSEIAQKIGAQLGAQAFPAGTRRPHQTADAEYGGV